MGNQHAAWAERGVLCVRAGGAVRLKGQAATFVLLSSVLTFHCIVINDCKMMWSRRVGGGGAIGAILFVTETNYYERGGGRGKTGNRHEGQV
jgi:hypothetical protein